RAPAAALLPLVESGAGLDALDAIAGAPGVLRLALGHLDLQADLGLACGPGEEELAPARWEIVRATRRAGLAPPVDGVTTALRDAGRIAEDTRRGLRMGFGAKLCIHPAQVPVVHQALAPGEDEAAQARRVLAAAEAARGGVCMLDGRMVDAPVIALARRVAARVPGGRGTAGERYEDGAPRLPPTPMAEPFGANVRRPLAP
ncbi:MAG: aldolase/citrate lyase family protein, partial [Xenophilus sp.]